MIGPRLRNAKFLLMAGLLMLGGCGGFAVAEGASTVVSGKTVSDHVISLASGKNCSVFDLSED